MTLSTPTSTTPTITRTPPTPASTAAADAPVDRRRVIAAIVAAFTADPFVRWLYPDADRYLEAFPQVLSLTGGPAFDGGTADHTAGYTGAALWVPPGSDADEGSAAELVAGTIDPDRHDDVFSLLEQMAEHHPGEPCWYLPFIGVDPRYQGRGHGSRLLSTGLARSDRDGIPAFLEASSAQNRALYERHGFVVTAEIRAGDSPPLWPMRRVPARPTSGIHR